MSGTSNKLGNVATMLLLGVLSATGSAYAQEAPKAPAKDKDHPAITIVTPDGKTRIVTAEELARIQELQKFEEQLGTFAQVIMQVREISAGANNVTTQKMMEGALKGALEALDAHSLYLNDEQFKQMMQESRGQYGGVGLVVAPAGQLTVVIAPTEGAPGERAGIKSGDYIVRINGQSILGQSIQTVADRLKGEPDTDVKVTVVREGAELPEFTLKRQIIETHAVTKAALIGNIGYIKLSTFANDHAAQEVEAAVKKLRDDSHDTVAGFVIDLQDNPGGDIRQVQKIADDFLDGRQEIVSVRSNIPEFNEVIRAKPGDITGGKPLVVLINKGSASASEILAAAIQDNGRGEVIGEQSFGKGSVQQVIPLRALLPNVPGSENMGGVLVTMALHHRPQGATIQDNGVKPNLVFNAAADTKKIWRPAEADMPGALANPNQTAQATVRNDGTCAAVNPNLPAAGLNPALVGKDGKPDFPIMCAVEFLEKATGQTPSGHIKFEAPQVLPSINSATPAPIR